MVQQKKLRTLCDLAEIAEHEALVSNRSAVHAQPQAMRSSKCLSDAGIVVPQFHAPGVIPFDPFSVHRVIPVLLFRQRLARPFAELTRTVIAIANLIAI